MTDSHTAGVERPPGEFGPQQDADDEVFGVVHIAGHAVNIGDLLRQPCAWCGDRLVDYDLARIAVPEGQSGPATWPVNALVLVDGGMKAVVKQPADGRLPVNACVALPPKRFQPGEYGEPPQAAVDAVIAFWASVFPKSEAPLLRDTNRVQNLARLAAKAVLAGEQR